MFIIHYRWMLSVCYLTFHFIVNFLRYTATLPHVHLKSLLAELLCASLYDCWKLGSKRPLFMPSYANSNSFIHAICTIDETMTQPSSDTVCPCSVGFFLSFIKIKGVFALTVVSPFWHWPLPFLQLPFYSSKGNKLDFTVQSSCIRGKCPNWTSECCLFTIVIHFLQ